MTAAEFPEHEKLKALNGANQHIGEFLEWLNDHGYVICEWDAHSGHQDGAYMSVNRSIQSWIAQFFQIDPVKIEAEKRQMIEMMRQANQNQGADA